MAHAELPRTRAANTTSATVAMAPLPSPPADFTRSSCGMSGTQASGGDEITVKTVLP